MNLRMKISRTLFALLTAAWLCPGIADAEPLNVRDFGANGQDREDDTQAIQKALDALDGDAHGKLVIPHGTYRVSETLVFGRKGGNEKLIVGEGKDTVLLWTGEPGGTLLETYGVNHTEFRDLSFLGHGSSKNRDRWAGILFHVISERGGNHINRVSNVRFKNAEVGIQMGVNKGDICNADYAFDHIHASHLGSFFRSVNYQAVDFLFNFVFALNCDVVFDFRQGGNLTVNNAQLTKCLTYLHIGGGGRNAGTFIGTNIRHEEARHPMKQRDQLLDATDIEWEQALVKFIGYTDAQWTWFRHEAENRGRPLCDIGPGVNVVFESSVFNGPVARVHGKPDKPAAVTVRESTYGFLLPHHAFTANEHGYVRSVNNFTDFMEPLPDLVKWPELPTMRIAADSMLEPAALPAPIHKATDAIEKLKKQRKAWIEDLGGEKQ